jgi:hypothetical protein
MSEEREGLNKAFNRSRSRLAYVNIGLAIVLVLACVNSDLHHASELLTGIRQLTPSWEH